MAQAKKKKKMKKAHDRPTEVEEERMINKKTFRYQTLMVEDVETRPDILDLLSST